MTTLRGLYAPVRIVPGHITFRRRADNNGRGRRGQPCNPAERRYKSQKTRITRGIGEYPLSATYLAAVTDFTEMVAPSAVPVTLAWSHASLLRVSNVA